VDVDGPVDLLMAEAVLRSQSATHSNLDNTVAVGGRNVGPGQAVYVIAEAGVNHNGSLETALGLVDAAARAGADAVKFQMFRAADLASADAATAPYQQSATGESSQRDMLTKLELSLEAFQRIKTRCDELGISFLATPFGIDEVRSLARLNSPAVKLASTDLTNGPLIDAAIKTGLPLIVSTGAAVEYEIHQAVGRITAAGARGRLVLMHCVSCYPTPPKHANLRAIRRLSDLFGVPVGFSDHTTAVDTGGLAVVAGASVLEKHFTLDPHATGPDHAMSLSLDQLRDYIANVREAEAALGTGELGMNEMERPVRAVARRSIAAATDIAGGSELSDSLLTLKRPGTGMAPEHLSAVAGRRARTDIAAGTLLSWDMIS
jgi:sialic acid synthase SpsE